MSGAFSKSIATQTYHAKICISLKCLHFAYYCLQLFILCCLVIGLLNLGVHQRSTLHLARDIDTTQMQERQSGEKLTQHEVFRTTAANSDLVRNAIDALKDEKESLKKELRVLLEDRNRLKRERDSLLFDKEKQKMTNYSSSHSMNRKNSVTTSTKGE